MNESQDQSQEQSDKEALEAFNSGFEGKTNEPLPDDNNEQQQAADEGEHQSDEPAPEYVQLTRKQFEDMQSRLGAIDDLKTAYAKTSGSIGNLNQIIEQLRSQTKQGEAVELTDDVVADLRATFGDDELTQGVLSALKKAAPALRGTGTAIDPAQIEAQFEAKYSARRVAELQQELSEEHPDWMTVRNTPEFKDWKAKLPIETQTRLDTSNSVTFLSARLTEFKDSLKKKQEAEAMEAERQKAAAERGNARREIVSAAVQPRGDGGHATAKTANDDFHAGFNKIAGKR